MALVLSPTQAAEKLVAALALFERTLETPLVSGELDSWLCGAKEACDRVGPPLRARILREQSKLIEAGSSRDEASSPRADELREAAFVILEAYEAIERRLRELVAVAVEIEPREDKFDAHLQELAQDGLAFIVMTRRQDAALDEWHR